MTSDLTAKSIALFKHLCTIPRPSKHYSGMHDFFKKFAADNKAEIEIDSAGNVALLMNPPFASQRKSLILQSHMDMVSLADEKVKHDWISDPILLKHDKKTNILSAQGTTLGADNGMGLATSLVLAQDCSKETPFNLYLLVTADEEQNLEGAKNLNLSLLPSEASVINLDSESSHEICVGSAGTSKCQIRFEARKVRENNHPDKNYCLQVFGGLGGHSGVEIHKGRANAIKVACDLVGLHSMQSKESLLRVSSIDGGQAENAIPSSCKIEFAMDPKHRPKFEDQARDFIVRTQKAFNEPSLNFQLEESKNPSKSEKDISYVLDFIRMTHQGVMGLNQLNPDQLKTSNNIGLASTDDNGEVTVTLLTRSLDLFDLEQYETQMRLLASYCKAKSFTSCGKTPAWCCDTSKSVAYGMLQKAHDKCFGSQAKAFSVHAGLETAILLSHYPKWDIVSIGPQIMDAHTTRESLDLSSIPDFVTWLAEIIQNCPKF